MGNSDDESLKSETCEISDLRNEQNQPLPPIMKTAKTKNGSITVDVEKNDLNETEFLKTLSHQEILKWLEERNLGKILALKCNSYNF